MAVLACLVSLACAARCCCGKPVICPSVKCGSWSKRIVPGSSCARANRCAWAGGLCLTFPWSIRHPLRSRRRGGSTCLLAWWLIVVWGTGSILSLQVAIYRLRFCVSREWSSRAVLMPQSVEFTVNGGSVLCLSNPFIDRFLSKWAEVRVHGRVTTPCFGQSGCLAVWTHVRRYVGFVRTERSIMFLGTISTTHYHSGAFDGFVSVTWAKTTQSHGKAVCSNDEPALYDYSKCLPIQDDGFTKFWWSSEVSCPICHSQDCDFALDWSDLCQRCMSGLEEFCQKFRLWEALWKIFQFDHNL